MHSSTRHWRSGIQSSGLNVGGSKSDVGCWLLVVGRFLPGSRHTHSLLYGTRVACVIFVFALLSLIGARSAASELDWTTAANHRRAALTVPANGKTGFTLLDSPGIGIPFTNHLARRSVAYNRIFESGSGVALGDIDGDGRCDIYFCRLEGPNVLYRNLGDWKFQDVTPAAGVACPNQYSTGAVFADVDGDDDLDLLVNSIGGGTRQFLNDGSGHFSEVTTSRLVRRFGSTSMALGDVDADGDLDLYVTNYRTDTFRDRPPGLKVEAQMVNGQIVVTPRDRFIPIMPRGGAVEVIELGERDFLYINNGGGNFLPVSWASRSFLDAAGNALTATPLEWGLSVMLRDLNGDSAPDVYVCNDFFYSLDRLWLNQSSRGFRAIDPVALRHISLSSMAVDSADINRDGHDDFFVVDMLSRSHANRHRQRPNMMKGVVELPTDDPAALVETPRNTLFLNRGDGTFAEIAHLSGLAATEWSWSVAFVDVDLDGFEDVLVGTGNFHDVQDADVLQQISVIRDAESPEQRMQRFPVLAIANLAFRNNGDLTFEETSAQWGFDLNSISHGMALGDLDNDGDLDVVLNNLNSSAAIYRNDSTAPRIAVRLKGNRPNTKGIGAKIRITGGPIAQSQEMISGGRYLSGDDAIRTFAAGASGDVLGIEVIWRDGKRTLIDDVRPNHLYEISESGSAPMSNRASADAPADAAPLFADISNFIAHSHFEASFDELAQQPLLPHRLSRLGPGVAWVDYDRDGWEDLAIGAARGSRLAVFRNDGKGGFAKLNDPAWLDVAPMDQTTVLGWVTSATNAHLLVARANYEAPTQPSTVQRYDIASRERKEVIANLTPSIGPMAMSDIDADGDLDLFVGGRVQSARYPVPVSSFIYRNDDGRFEIDETNSVAFRDIGMISGAVFSDLDADGDSELVLASEWGPIRIFRNDRGRFQSWAPPVKLRGGIGAGASSSNLPLNDLTGWWNAIAAGDFDGDGRMDLLAANWGRNTKYQEALATPLRLYYGEFNGDPGLELIEAYHSSELNKVVPWRDFESVSRVIPLVRERVSTFRQYGNSSVQELLGSQWPAASELKAATLDSMVFLNRGDHFESLPLTSEAQFAPAFGITVGDFDGDGHEDVVLAQNFFGVEPETTRYDAGRGLLLRGAGDGTFSPVPGQRSGIIIYGEQRGCAAADFNGDGRLDLAVAQNNGPVKLYRNEKGTPGLRVHLNYSPDNPAGIGAVIRGKSGDRFGPAREVRCGSGYWSQDAASQVLSAARPISELWVRWPGGKETTHAVAPGAKEIQLSPDTP